MKTKLFAVGLICAVCLFGQQGLTEPKKTFFQKILSPWDSSLGAPTFPTGSYFRHLFSNPSTRVELQPPARLADYVQGGKLVLSLRAFLELVMANNTDIAIQTLSVETSRNSILSAYGRFDPSLSFSFSNSRSATPSTSQLEGATIRKSLSQPMSIGYNQTLETGTSLGLTMSGTKSSSNDVFATRNPSFSSNFRFNFTQPLWRNRGAYITRMPITIAKMNLRSSELNTENQLMGLVQSAENAYWDLVAGRESLRVQAEALAGQKRSYDRTQQELELGAIAELDRYRPEASYKTAQLQYVQAQFNLQRLEDALRVQIGADLDPKFRTMPIELTERVEPPAQLPTYDREAVIEKALENRPDIKSARIGLEVDDLNLKSTVNNMRPNLSLTGNYSSNGTGGTEYVRAGGLGGGIVDVIPGGLYDALGAVFGFDNTSYSLGISLTLPLRDRSSQASLANSLISKRRDTLNLRRSEQQIRQSILSAITNLESSAQSIELAKVSRDLAQKQAEAEQLKYDLGTSQMYLVLDAQYNLTSAENRLTTEYINYHRNRLSLLRQTGELLQERNIVLQ